MTRIGTGRILAATMLCALFYAAPVFAAGGAIDTHDTQAFAPGGAATALLAKAARDGRVMVIAGLDLAMRPEDGLSPAEQQAQALVLATAQDAVLARVLRGRTGGDIVKYRFIPYVALHPDRAELARLFADPTVHNVTEDFVLRPSGAESYAVTVTETDSVWDLDFDGKKQVVAILDTGVDAKHPMLKGKLVAEACYSTNLAKQYASTCPGGKTSSTAPGSGTYCSLTIQGCDHGTGVASVAVGRDEKKDGAGIARGADYISIKVFSENLGDCGSRPKPCPGAVNADVVSGLTQVYALRNNFKIAAANLSLGSGLLSATCDTALPAMTSIITLLRAANIAVTVAAGNDSTDGKIGFPACISTAIAVASSTPDDEVYPGSDFDAQIALVAPGLHVPGAVPKGKYAKLTGTSFAAPLTAGAFAVLRQVEPTADVATLTKLLACAGQPVTREGVTKSRWDLLRAYAAVKNPPSGTQTFNFATKGEADYWTEFLGTWKPLGGFEELFQLNNSSTANGIWFAACQGNVAVTGVMDRVSKDTSTNWPSSLIIDAAIDQNNKTASGYWFTFGNLFGSIDGQIVEINRIDNYNFKTGDGGFTQLCFEWPGDDVLNINGTNTLKAQQQNGALKLYLNGQLVCSASDNTYNSGNVMVEAEIPLPVPHGDTESFTVKSVTIAPLP